MKTLFKNADKLFLGSKILTTLLIIQSVGGLFIPNLYRDSKEIIASWNGNDLITLLVATPSIIIAMYYSRRGSLFAQYAWFSLIFYTFYNNCYYLLGASLNSFFLVYILIFITSIVLLLIVAANYYHLDISQYVLESKILKTVVITTLLIFATLMTFLWVSEWLKFIIFNTKPLIPGMNEGYSLVAALDLSIQIPLMFFGVALYWQNKKLGYFLSFISTISNTVYLLVLIAFCPFAERAGIEKAWEGLPIFGSLFCLCLISTLLFYKNSKKTQLD